MDHKDLGNSEKQYIGDINKICSHQALINSIYRILNALGLSVT
jgi:hypothetical protein